MAFLFVALDRCLLALSIAPTHFQTRYDSYHFSQNLKINPRHLPNHLLLGKTNNSSPNSEGFPGLATTEPKYLTDGINELTSQLNRLLIRFQPPGRNSTASLKDPSPWGEKEGRTKSLREIEILFHFSKERFPFTVKTGIWKMRLKKSRHCEWRRRWWFSVGKLSVVKSCWNEAIPIIESVALVEGSRGANRHEHLHNLQRWPVIKSVIVVHLATDDNNGELTYPRVVATSRQKTKQMPRSVVGTFSICCFFFATAFDWILFRVRGFFSTDFKLMLLFEWLGLFN